MNVHESGFLEFVTDRSLGRLRTMLELGPKRREGFREALHQVEFKPRYTRALTGPDGLYPTALRTLEKAGAPPVCFVLSRLPEFDGQEWSLDEAVEMAAGADEATFLSCLPGKLGFFGHFKTTLLLVRDRN